MHDLLCSIDNSVVGSHSVVTVKVKNQLYSSHLQTERWRVTLLWSRENERRERGKKRREWRRYN